MTALDPIAVAVEFARLAERLGVPYLVGGSIASTPYGEPRATLDVDFAVHLAPEVVSPLCDALEESYYVHRESALHAAVNGGLFNAIHLRSLVEVDVYARPREGSDGEEIRRALRSRIGEGAETAVNVASPEDTVLQKLAGYRLGDDVSDRQWRDVLGVLEQVGERLDAAYMTRWATTLGIDDLLTRALREADWSGELRDSD